MTKQKSIVVFARALVVVALVAAVSLAIYSKREDNPIDETAPTKQAQIPRLLEIGADKCIPCKMMAPILEELSKTYPGRLEVEFLDVWKNPDAGKLYVFSKIPTQIFFDASGKEVFRHEGFFGKEDILAKWKELGVELDSQEGMTEESTTVPEE